jgi:hypothetical protein
VKHVSIMVDGGAMIGHTVRPWLCSISRDFRLTRFDSYGMLVFVRM